MEAPPEAAAPAPKETEPKLAGKPGKKRKKKERSDKGHKKKKDESAPNGSKKRKQGNGSPPRLPKVKPKRETAPKPPPVSREAREIIVISLGSSSIRFGLADSVSPQSRPNAIAFRRKPAVRLSSLQGGSAETEDPVKRLQLAPDEEKELRQLLDERERERECSALVKKLRKFRKSAPNAARKGLSLQPPKM